MISLDFELCSGLLEFLDDLAPGLKPSRGTYDRESKTFSGNYPHVIRAVFKEITGKDEPLDHLIKEVVDHRRTK